MLPSATQRTPPASRSVTPMRTPVKSEDKEGDGTPGKRVARNSLGDEYAEDDEFDEGEAGGLLKHTFERRLIDEPSRRIYTCIHPPGAERKPGACLYTRNSLSLSFSVSGKHYFHPAEVESCSDIRVSACYR